MSQRIAYEDIQFNGQLGFNDPTQVLTALGVDLDNISVTVTVRNNSGALISAGDVVYISGATGNNATIALTDATSSNAQKTLGIVKEDIEDNATGVVVVAGQLEPIDTRAYTEGDVLYLNTVAGAPSNTPPTTDHHWSYRIGYVETSKAQGKILVAPQFQGTVFGRNFFAAPSAGSVRSAIAVNPDTYVKYSSLTTQTINGNVSLQTGWFTQGDNAVATAIASHAEGHDTTANGAESHAEGTGTTASGTGAHSEGKNTQALGLASHSEGFNTIAKGAESHSEGTQTKASGTGAHAEGYYTRAFGKYSHAEGYSCVTLASYSHAQGQKATVNSGGKYGFARGYNTKVSQMYAYAGGHSSEATGYFGHADGYSAKAQGSFTRAIGRRAIVVSTAQGAMAVTDNSETYCSAITTNSYNSYFENGYNWKGGVSKFYNDIEVDDSANGLILKDSGSTRYRVTVSSTGSLVVTAI